ncbi:MAG: DUF433 domain-containing protein [Planctomycetes bacterium]|nr:DUF433 domain-containing protein [Planctomycetota bacterium]
MKFERITVDPRVCTGKPCIRGLRFPVSRLLGGRYDIRMIQELLSHKDVRTTMIYTPVLNRGVCGVKSPANNL